MLAYIANAQLLPDNKTLNAQSVERWMQSNRAMAPIMQLLDEMNATAEALQAFDALSPVEQDQQISHFLTEKNTLAAANRIATSYGWKSVGDYMRLSTKLGNAIAAYFLTSDLAQLPEEHANALREKTDPTILAVPEKDIAFVKANEKPLQQYIQAYAAGR
jgi:hypothetical protein